MPRANKNNSGNSDQPRKKSKNPLDNWTFCQIELTAEDKEVLRNGWTTEADFWAMLQLWTEEQGYKVSISYDDRNECVIFTLTGRAESNPNFGMVLSSRGPDLFGAYNSLVYKLDKYCRDGKWPRESRASDDQWG